MWEDGYFYYWICALPQNQFSLKLHCPQKERNIRDKNLPFFVRFTTDIIWDADIEWNDKLAAYLASFNRFCRVLWFVVTLASYDEIADLFQKRALISRL